MNSSSITTMDLAGHTPERRLSNRLKSVNWLFLLIVVVPSLFSVLYFGLMASDVFISESRFLVRSPQKQVNTGIGAFLQGAGFSRSQDDTYTVQDYILSRDALQKLETQYSMTKMYGADSIDLLSRFGGGFDSEKSFEALHRYYQRRVHVDVDSTSSISTLRASAYTAADAGRINERLLELSEQLVNTLNERGRQDLIRSASVEVTAAEARSAAATLAISQFRGLRGVFDPEKQSSLQLQLVSKLQDELITITTQIAEVTVLARDNPQLASLRNRKTSIQSAIETETAKIASGGARSLSSRSAEYERLALERLFAERQLTSALASLEQARNEAQRKQLYLERIVQPNIPDVAVEPKRFRAIGATIMLSFLVWGVATMLIAGVREHQN